VTSDRSRTSLETEYPHLSVVHLLKNRCISSEEVRIIQSSKPCQASRENLFQPLAKLDARTTLPNWQTCYLLTTPPHTSGALQQERPHYKELSEGVKRIDGLYFPGARNRVSHPHRQSPALQAIDHLRPSDAKQAGGSGHIAVGTRKRTLQ
jgi:hypothetical protein